MPTVLPNIGLTLPTRGAAGAGTWDDTLDANLALEDAHDHSPGKGLRITAAALNLTTDLTLNSTCGLTNTNRIQFASVAGPTGNKSIFVSDGSGGLAANELYWRSNAGSQVRLTSGSALNVAAFTGGIGGDYAAVGAAVNFDDSADRYTFKQNAGTGWARLACGDVRLFETGTSESIFVGLAAPAALAASYTITMPLASPGSTSLVSMDSSGVLTASNTVANAATFSTSISTPTVSGTPNFTGAVTMASTLGVTGLITATAGITAAANQHLTVSGTGRIKHGTYERHIHISAFQVDGASTYVTFNQIGYISGFGGACTVQAPLILDVGKRILTYQQTYDVNGTGAGIQPSIKRINVATGAVTDVVLGTSDSSGTGIETQAMNSINHTIAVGFAYYMVVSVSNANHRVYSAYIAYDEP